MSVSSYDKSVQFPNHSLQSTCSKVTHIGLTTPNFSLKELLLTIANVKLKIFARCT